jgi:hypothetical protein
MNECIKSKVRILVYQVGTSGIALGDTDQEPMIVAESVGGEQILGVDVHRPLPQFRLAATIIGRGSGPSAIEREGSGTKLDDRVF